jgi:hypothetical protein
MSERIRLSNRRGSENFSFECNGLRYTCTFSRFADGRISELFLSNHKTNSGADVNARDSAITFSIAVQHGADPEIIRRAPRQPGRASEVYEPGIVPRRWAVEKTTLRKKTREDTEAEMRVRGLDLSQSRRRRRRAIGL